MPPCLKKSTLSEWVKGQGVGPVLNITRTKKLTELKEGQWDIANKDKSRNKISRQASFAKVENAWIDKRFQDFLSLSSPANIQETDNRGKEEKKQGDKVHASEVMEGGKKN